MIFIAVTIVAMITYIVQGRHIFDGPVALVKKVMIEHERILYGRRCMIDKGRYHSIHTRVIFESISIMCVGHRDSDLALTSETFVQRQRGQGFSIAGAFFP